jgi:beta-lactamase class A
MALLAATQGDRRIDLEREIILREKDRVAGDGRFDQAPAGARRTVRELIAHTIRESDNTAGNLLIDTIGMARVNEWMEAAPYRLQATRLRRHFMDFAAVAAGQENVTTAREMCILFTALLDQQAVFAPILQWLTESPYDDKLVAGIPSDVVVAHKTGDLPGIEHDAGIVYAATTPYIVVLLSAALPAPEVGKTTLAVASRLIYQRLEMLCSSGTARPCERDLWNYK